MDFVPQSPGRVPVVDRGPARQIQLEMSRLLRSHAHQGLSSISVVEMSILKEAYAFGAELVVTLRFGALVCTLVLRLAREPTVAGFKVRARDV